MKTIFKVAVAAMLLALPGNLMADPGKAAYDRLCASCHGMGGAGDGPVGKALPAGLLPNLQTDERKYATDDEKLKEFIVKGGAAVGLSPMMPPHAGLSDEDLVALVQYTNSLKKDSEQ